MRMSGAVRATHTLEVRRLSIRNDPDFRVPLAGILLLNGSTY